MNHRLAASAVILIVAAACTHLSADEKPERITVATWNLEWFFDDFTPDNRTDLAKEQSAPSREEWEWKRDLVAAAIAEMKPTILALQEVESRPVAYYLTKQLREKHGLKYRVAFIDGYDFYTEQDVAILFQGGLVEYSRREQDSEMYESGAFANIPKHIFARFEWGHGDERERLTLLNLHLRAMEKGAFTRLKQCRLVRAWLAEQIAGGENVIVLGDVNTDEPFGSPSVECDMHTLVTGETTGDDDDLADLHSRLKPEDRLTHLIGKQFDRILVSRPLLHDADGRRDLVFRSIVNRKDLVVRGEKQDEDHWNIFYKIPPAERDLSDHYPLVAEFEFR